MRDPKTISEDGFSLAGASKHHVLFMTLRTALRAYFSSYDSVRVRLRAVSGPADAEVGQEVQDQQLGPAYIEASTETLVHFQHFIELFLKAVLRAEHELLAGAPRDRDRQDVLMHRLLQGEAVADSDLEQLWSIEFSDALRRACALIKAGRLGGGALAFVGDAKPWMKQVNTLRNRAWHRGRFVLRYDALDELVAGYVLPFVVSVTSLPEFSGQESWWKYRPLHCGLDPIEQIIIDGGSNPRKLALLKELARAAYENPLRPDSVFSKHTDRAHISRAEAAAGSEEPNDVSSVRTCPVCGVDALVVYDDMDYHEQPDGSVEDAVLFTYEARCFGCGLHLWSEVGNPVSDHGLIGLEDLWEQKLL